MRLSSICIRFEVIQREVANGGREVGTTPYTISPNWCSVWTWASCPSVSSWRSGGGNWKSSWVVWTTFSSSSIRSAFNVSLTLLLVYPHSIKSAKVSGGLDVHLHFTPWSVPCSARSSTYMVTEDPLSEYFCLSWCGLVGKTVASSTTGIGWVSIECLRLVMSFIFFSLISSRISLGILFLVWVSHHQNDQWYMVLLNGRLSKLGFFL